MFCTVYWREGNATTGAERKSDVREHDLRNHDRDLS